MDIRAGQRWEYHYAISGTHINEQFIAEVLPYTERVRVVQVFSSHCWKVGDEFGHSISVGDYWIYLSGQDTPNGNTSRTKLKVGNVG